MTATEERVLTRQGEDRRADLLAHAERLFAEHGYAATRMADIAEAAGVAKGLVYWYFENKEALVLDVIRDVRERLRVAQMEAVQGVTAPLDILYVGTVASVTFIADHATLWGSIQGADTDPRYTTAMRESTQVHANDSVAVLEAGQADGTVRPDEDPLVLALANQGVVGQLVVAHLRGSVDPLQAAAHAAARFAVRSAAATPEHAEATIARNASG